MMIKNIPRKREDAMTTRPDRRNTMNSAGERFQPHRRLIWWLIPLLALDFAACCSLRPLDSKHEIDIRFAQGGGREPSIQPISGWPLTLILTANEEELLGVSSPFATSQRKGYVVFEDPDDCPSWLQDCKAPPDETQVEFTPGFHLPKAGDCSGQPEVKSFDETTGTNDGSTPIGPCLEPPGKGYGYGANPRLPGLVVLADAGPGVVTDEDFDRPSPPEARNLAGLFQSVAYALKDSRGRTSIVAHMNVPARLFAPIALSDRNVSGLCQREVRVDGEDRVCSEEWNPRAVTIRAFVVNGREPQTLAVNRRAPAVLANVNGDDVIDIADAERAGWQLLSGQATLEITQTGGWSVVPHDLDGNGSVGEPVSPPPDPGELKEPPR